ncbi:MAG: helix-turn-helix domain-containing protein [Qingshengfaniella sp.]
MVKTVEALRRGLRVLDTLFEDGPMTLTDLSHRTGLSKATLLRILATLREAGHVRRGLGDRLWYASTIRHGAVPTALADVMAEVSGPVIRELCTEIQWPSDVGVYEDAGVRMVETSRLMSPFLSHRLLYRGVEVLPSAIGRAILAWTSDSHRAEIIADLAERGGSHDRMVHDRTRLDAMLAEVRARGYATRLRGYVVVLGQGADISAVALPVMRGDRAIAGVSLSWMPSAMTEADFVAAYLGRLRQAVDLIAARMEPLLVARS